jgi:hypothetical protein
MVAVVGEVTGGATEGGDGKIAVGAVAVHEPTFHTVPPVLFGARLSRFNECASE